MNQSQKNVANQTDTQLIAQTKTLDKLINMQMSKDICRYKLVKPIEDGSIKSFNTDEDWLSILNPKNPRIGPVSTSSNTDPSLGTNYKLNIEYEQAEPGTIPKEDFVSSLNSSNPSLTYDVKTKPTVSMSTKIIFEPKLIYPRPYLPSDPNLSFFEDNMKENIPLWMAQPKIQPNCPYGVEYLTDLDHIQIQQVRHKDGLSVSTCYMVINDDGQYVYKIETQMNCIYKFLCVACRRYDLNIYDADNYEVMHFSKLRVVGGHRSVEVFAPLGKFMGKIYEVREDPPLFIILDSSDEVLFRIHIQSAPPLTENFIFSITSVDGSNDIAQIVQEYSNLMRKIYHTDYLSIYYFTKLDAKIKALIMGAAFLVAFIYFESLDIKI